MTERDRLEANAAVILAGVLQALRFTEHTFSEKVGLAVDYAAAVRAEVREREPHAWEKQEGEDADVPV